MASNTRLNNDPLPWLLARDALNPGVRYFALRDLLDRPADDTQVIQAQSDVMATGPVPLILAAQSRNGSWCAPVEKAGHRTTDRQIVFLAELGADAADGRVQLACDYLLDTYRAANGALALQMPRPVPSKAVHCHNGDLLHALLRLGRFDDRRVQSILAWQIQAITGEGDIQYYKSGTAGPAFACGANLSQPCAWGATKALKALALIPAGQRTPLFQQAIDAGVDFLLSHDLAVADYPFTGQISGSWFKFGFPLSYQSDILETTAALVTLGYGKDPRLEHAIDFILSKQDRQGRWRLERSLNGKMIVDIEERGKPSKWITLRVLRLLKAMERA
jgi:hypothetical protein